MNVYVDKSFSPKSEAGAAEFDKYLQTSDTNDEEETTDEDSEDEFAESEEFDPKTEVQLDKQVYEYTGEDFDPKSE
jgi:hypothetical protein